jgi:probable blue pigment (indigoidine) exporter
VYLGLVGTALAYMLWFHGIGLLAATRVSLLGLLSPLVAVVVGVALASEHFGVAQAVGTALVLSGVLLGQRPRLEASAAPMPERWRVRNARRRRRNYVVGSST